MADQTVRLILCGYRHAADSGIECVGQSEIDDTQLAAEIDRRFGAAIRQFHEPASPPTGEDISHRVPGQGGGGGTGRQHDRLLPEHARFADRWRTLFGQIPHPP
jgi:hypothetical protein